MTDPPGPDERQRPRALVAGAEGARALAAAPARPRAEDPGRVARHGWLAGWSRPASPHAEEPRLTSLPDHMLDDLMSLLSVPERLLMGAVPNRRLNAALDDQVRAARLQHSAPGVRSLDSFLHALHGTGDAHAGRTEAAVALLPRRLQREPLVAMGSRIAALPEPDRPHAAAAWSAFPFHGTPDELFDELRRAAARGADGIQQREQDLVGEWGEAYVEVLRGGLVSQVAQARGISGPLSIEMLEQAAARVIGENLSEGDHLPTLLARAGLRTESAAAQIQFVAALRVGAAAIRQGRPVADLVERMGITSPPALRVLRIEAARHDVARGVPAPEAVRNHGLEELQSELEAHAGLTIGRRRALGGESAARIAQELGLQAAPVIAQLEHDAAHDVENPPPQSLVAAALASQGGAAFEAIMAGEAVQDVARRHGISDPIGIGLLEHLAVMQLEDTFRAIDHLPSRLAEAGVTSPHHVEQLELWVAAGPGTTAVQQGREPSAVAERLGITSDAALHVLELSAAEGDIARGVPAHEVFVQRRITEGEEQRGLESWALVAHGQRALDDGEPVPQVAQRLGLRQPEVIQSLHWQAATTVGRSAVGAGEDPHVVAQRLGIADPGALRLLALAAAQRDVEMGETPRDAITRRGIEDPDHRLAVEVHAVVLHGVAALQAGEPVNRIRRQLGLEHPRAVQMLRLLGVLNEAPPWRPEGPGR